MEPEGGVLVGGAEADGVPQEDGGQGAEVEACAVGALVDDGAADADDVGFTVAVSFTAVTFFQQKSFTAITFFHQKSFTAITFFAKNLVIAVNVFTFVAIKNHRTNGNAIKKTQDSGFAGEHCHHPQNHG